MKKQKLFTINSSVGLFSKEGIYYKRTISAALRKGEMVLMKQEDGTIVAIQANMPEALNLYDPNLRRVVRVPVQEGICPGYPLDYTRDEEHIKELLEAYEI